MLAAGASPLRPPAPGIDAVGVYGVQTLDDGAALLAGLEALGEGTRRALIIGGGSIGIEMAEAMCSRGLEVTVVTMGAEPMDTLDPDMGRLVHEAMVGMGIDVRTATTIEALETDAAGRAVGARAGGELFAADLVVLGTGVRPNGSGRRSRAAAGPVRGFAHRPPDACAGVRQPVGRGRLRRGARPGLQPAGGGGPRDAREQARAGHRHQRRRRLRELPRGGAEAISKVCDLEIARTGLREADVLRPGSSR